MKTITSQIKAAAIFAWTFGGFAAFGAATATTYFDTNTVDDIQIEWAFEVLKDGNARIMAMSNVVEDVVIENAVVPETVRDPDGVEHTVTTIGKYAFMNKASSGSIHTNTTLKRIEFPLTVTKIEDGGRSGDDGRWNSKEPGAFKFCTALGEVVMAGVKHIGENAFAECSSLTNAVLTDTSITNIGGMAFKDTKITGDLDLSNLMTSKLLTSTFQNTRITSIKIPTVTSIGVHPTWPNKLDSGGNTFAGCSALTNIVLSPNLTLLRAGSNFNGCEALENEEFVFEKVKGRLYPSTFKSVSIKRAVLPLVTGLDDWVFQYCTNLERVERLCSVEFISGRNQLKSASKLKEIKFPHCLKEYTRQGNDLLPNTIERVFVHVCSPLTAGMLDGTIKTGAKLTALIPYGGAWTNEVNGRQVEWRYDDCDTPDYSFSNKATIVCATDLTGEVTIPTTLRVSALDENGASVMTNLTVTAIEVGALRNNAEVTTLTIPKTVTRIGDEAFAGCTSLQKIVVYRGTALDCEALRAEYPGVEIKEKSSGFAIIVR